MTEEEASFDPSLKKKKKKKKTPFDLDAALGDSNKNEADAEPVADNDAAEDADFGKKKKKKKVVIEEDEEAAGDNKDEDGEDIDLETFGKKKKKKKKDALNLDDLDKAVDDLDEVDEDLDLESFGKKKKKKKRAGDGLGESMDNEDNKENESVTAWAATDRDYTYDELLQRVFDIMKDKNPEMVAGEKKKFVMRPPDVVKVGTKKTAFVNFTDIAKMLHRQPRHLLAFLFAELGTQGAIDGSNQLIIKGRFQQKHIEHVLRRYIKEYVTCHTCRSPDTILDKETRIFFLNCMQCGSRCSVQAIKTGFQAVTGKRSAIKAKAN